MRDSGLSSFRRKLPSRTADRRLGKAKRRQSLRLADMAHTMFMHRLNERMARELYLAQPQGNA